MITVPEIKNIMLEQEQRMADLFKNENIIKREFPLLQKHIATGAANIIMGPRRCGKSIFTFELVGIEKAGYINFDDERLTIQANELNKVLEAVYSLKGNVDTIIFDEIQEVRGWEKFISRLIDTKKIIITGSNARLMSKELSTYMTGRHVDRELLPFSFKEFLSYEKFNFNQRAFTTRDKAVLINLLEKYLVSGGFPLVFKFGRSFLADLYNDIINRDIIQRHNIKLSSKLSEVVRYVISNSSSETSYNKVRNIFSIKGKSTVSEWLKYLEQAYVVFTLERFSFKLKESVMAPKKIYAIDTGFTAMLSVSKDKWRLMENAVAIELLRGKNYSFNEFEINYWKNHEQKEVDFLIRKNNKILQLIQVTLASDKKEIQGREMKNLITASQELRCNNLLVITWDYEAEEVQGKKKIKFTPFWKWLLAKDHNTFH